MASTKRTPSALIITLFTLLTAIVLGVMIYGAWYQKATEEAEKTWYQSDAARSARADQAYRDKLQAREDAAWQEAVEKSRKQREKK